MLQCVGRIVQADALRYLERTVTSLPNLRMLVLDLSTADGIDAGGLGTLVFLHNWARSSGIQVKLVNPSKLLRQMLEMTGLTSVLHISSVKDVIQMFCSSGRLIENVKRAAA